MRDVRELGFNNDHQHPDLRDPVDAQQGDDLVFALIEMRAETLVRVDEAVRRCDEGTYGYCVDCGEVIAPVRLRALPFAVRCRDCEETREGNQRQERARMQQACQIPWRSRDVSGA